MSRLLSPLALLALLLSPALAQDAKPPALTWSFETDADTPFVPREGVAVSRVTDHATAGQYALRVVCKGSDKPTWPALFLYPDKANPDWSARVSLSMDIFLETPDTVTFGAQLCLLDRNDAKTVSLGDLKPGWNRGLTLWLQDFGWDLNRVRDLCLYLGQPRRDVVYYVDNVRWETSYSQQAGGGWLNASDVGASGSSFQTTGKIAAGSNQITVADPGDFKVGQGVIISRCNIQYQQPRLWGPGEPYSTSKTLGDEAEFRGYDGSAGSWNVYLLEVDGENPATFRWSDDLARTWKGTKVPITYDWQKLSGGTEVRLKRMDWKKSHMITVSARDQLLTTIQSIEGNVLTLADTANRAAGDCVVLHNDTAALQAAVDRAIRTKCNLFIPHGYYRLTTSLRVNRPSLTIQGEDGVNTILDISAGQGGCFALSQGTECTIRNFRMIGHTGLAQAAGAFRMSNGTASFWACALKGCNAVSINATERVLIENVHASQMASEAFYCQGPSRVGGQPEPKQYCKQLTFLRCSVTDCAANAFNNNDTSENTSMLYCRVDGAGWHAYEGPARFIRVEGCYIRNAGPITIGDMSHRSEPLHILGCGQAIVRNNVFEGIGRCEGVAVNHGARQVVISDNLFINYNGPAINVSSYTVRTSYPSQNMIVANNVIDMTYPREDPKARTGINVTASNVIVANNQVYVRGATDPRVTGIRIAEPALNVNVHDNLVQNCTYGIVTRRVTSRITEVVDETTFVEDGLPLEWNDSHRYRNWNLVWLTGANQGKVATLDGFDPATLRFKLKAPLALKVGDSFEVYAPEGPNWTLHDNTISGCQFPVVLDSYGGAAADFSRNTLERGGCDSVKLGLEVRGRFALLGNHLVGFTDPAGAALALYPDKLGKPLAIVARNNVFERCTNVVAESQPGLWDALQQSGNLYLECGKKPGG